MARKLKLLIFLGLLAGLIFTVPALAEAPETQGEFLVAPIIDQIDENGVDLSTGYFQVSAPGLSAGSADHSMAFSMRWAGRNWTTNLPSIWYDDGHFFVRHGGMTTEFRGEGGSYAEIAPIRGNTLYCELGDSGPNDYCTYNSRTGEGVLFFVQPRILIASLDNAFAPFGNFRAYPTNILDETLIRSAQPAGYSGEISYSTGSDRYQTGVFTISWGRADIEGVSINLTRRTTQGDETVQSLSVQTPNNSTNDLKDHFLYPKNTTQVITDPEGNDWRYTINSDREMTRVVGPDGSQVSISSYTNHHRVRTLTNDAGTWQYRYNSSDTYRTITRTNPLGGIATFKSHKDKGYIVEITDELGRTTYYDHDVGGTEYLARIRYPEGNSVEFDYDARGNITERRANAPGELTITETAGYFNSCNGTRQGQTARSCNRPQRVASGNAIASGNAYHDTEYRYADSGTSMPTLIHRARTPHPHHDGVEKHGRTVNSFATISGHRVLSTSSTCRRETTCKATGSLAIHTEIGYVGGTDLILPRTIRTRAGDNSLSATVTNSYDAQGNLIAVDGPLSGTADTSRYAYNANRQVIATVSPDPDGSGALKPQASRTRYDSMGRAIMQETGTVNSVTDTALSTFASLEKTATRYDAMGRPVLAASGTSSGTHAVVQTSYDALSRPICSAIRMNTATFPTISGSGVISGGSLPASACTLGTQGTSGPDRITHTTYDAAGQATSIRRAYRTSDQITYASYSYDRNGNQTAVTDANGNRTQFTYDGHGRLERWTFPSSTTPGAVNASDYEQYGYDKNGNRTSLRRRDGTNITYSYDALDRMTRKNLPGTANDVYYGHERQGQLLEARFGSDSGRGIISAYDQLGRITSSSNTVGGTTRTLTYAYDAIGNRTRITHPDGKQFHYSYDGLGRLDRVREASASGSIIADFTYDNQGRRVGNTASAGPSINYGYDAASRLSDLNIGLPGTSADLAVDFAYTPASQIAGRTHDNDAYSWAGANDGTTSYTSDGLNRYSRVAPSGGVVSPSYDARGNLTGYGSDTYSYDIENRLTSASVAGHDVTLTYDPTGRLHSVDSNDDVHDARFVWDGDALAVEYGLNGSTILRRHVHVPGSMGAPVATYGGSSVGTASRNYLTTDERGSVIAITQASDGTVVGPMAYGTYGEAQSSNVGRFQYTGHLWLGPNLPLYMRARVYSPELGRFMQTDPIGYDDNLNLYAYVGNDPVNGTDPSGEAVETAWDVFNIGIGITSLVNNVRQGNYGAAAIDGVGILVDSAAAVAPFIPGGAGTTIRTGRGLDDGIDAARNSGIVYRRTDTRTGRCYIGRCNNERLFTRRQGDHRRANREAQYEFDRLDQGIEPGMDLRRAEQRQIDAHGGPTNRSNPNGGTENRRNEIRQQRPEASSPGAQNQPCPSSSFCPR